MKKLAIVLLALALVLTTVLVPILATEDTDEVIGYSAERVKKVDLTNVADIKTFNKRNIQPGYKITDAEGLVKLSEIVNSGKGLAGVIIYLAKDLDMSSVENFTPIGYSDDTFKFASTNSSTPTDSEILLEEPSIEAGSNYGTKYPFEGVFDGHGHVISNLTCEWDSKDVSNVGLFGVVSHSAIIKNLIIDSSCTFIMTRTNGFASCAAVAARGGNIENVYNMANVTSSMHGAGISGTDGGDITNCTNAGDIVGINTAGGVIGFAQGDVDNCINTGDVACAYGSGGIIGRSRTPVKISNCINTGRISGPKASGILGIQENNGPATMTNCFNYGEAVGGDGLCQGDVTKDALSADKTGETYEYAAPVVTPDYDTEDGVGDGETAYTTGETKLTQVEGVLTNPTGNEVGYSSARIEKVNTSVIVNILNYEERPAEDAYKITTPEGLLKLDELLYTYNTFAGITIYLANDLDMSRISNFSPLSYDKGSYDKTTDTSEGSLFEVNDYAMFYFGGILDGQGHMIDNLVVRSTDIGPTSNSVGDPTTEALVCVGLFGYLGGATLKNLIISSDCIFSYNGEAVNPCVGAFSGKADNLTVDNCWNMAEISGGRFNGSISGRCGGSFTVSNYTNTGDVTGAQCVGGLFGWGPTCTITNSRNAGYITRVGSGTWTGSAAGGFIGRTASGAIIDGCINNGNIIASAHSGAFIGCLNTSSLVRNCKNYGELIATQDSTMVGLEYATKHTGTETMSGANNINYYGIELDETLLFEEIEPDFTPEPDGEIPDATDAETTAATPVKTTAARTTKAPSTTTTGANNSGNNSSDDEEEEKGCSSTVIGSIAVIALVSGAALVLFKKKED